MAQDVTARQNDAASLATRLVGPEPVGRLVQVMLDHEVPPAFMWRGIAGPVEDEAGAVRTRLASALDSSDVREEVRVVVEGFPALDRDMAKALLQMATTSAYFAIPETLLEIPSHDSRVFSTLPHLARRLDERGLLDVTGLRATAGALFVDDYALSYHQLLRRGFGSHVNDALLGHLLGLQRANGVHLRIALDERRLRLETDYRDWLEFDYWFGPHLTEDVLDEPTGQPSVLVHRWADADDPRRLMDPSEEFTIRLTRDGEVRTIEAEELITPERASYGTPFMLVRYLHAQRDAARHRFLHCDGAVRAYLPGAYAKRRGVQGLPRQDKDFVARYRKVFRVDGDISTDEWSQIVALWFRGNHLAIEALERLGSGSSTS